MVLSVGARWARSSWRQKRRSRRSPGGSWFIVVVAPAVSAGGGQCAQPFGAPPSSAVRKLEPHPQAATAFGLLTVKPAPISVST